MKSKWFNIKGTVIKERLKGKSIRELEKKFMVPKATLSGWLKDIVLSEKQKTDLKRKWLRNLAEARKNAVIWHNSQKEARIKVAEYEALSVFSKIDLSNKSVLELALSMLYLGEGGKTQQTVLGNSNPLILRFFISALKELYDFDVNKIKCELHLRADQDSYAIKAYWSEELNLPLENFKSVSIDKRTLGSATYPSYKGVCILQCGNIAIQRRLVYLSQIFCENVANLRAVSSVGRASA